MVIRYEYGYDQSGNIAQEYRYYAWSDTPVQAIEFVYDELNIVFQDLWEF